MQGFFVHDRGPLHVSARHQPGEIIVLRSSSDCYSEGIMEIRVCHVGAIGMARPSGASCGCRCSESDENAREWVD